LDSLYKCLHPSWTSATVNDHYVCQIAKLKSQEQATLSTQERRKDLKRSRPDDLANTRPPDAASKSPNAAKTIKHDTPLKAAQKRSQPDDAANAGPQEEHVVDDGSPNTTDVGRMNLAELRQALRDRGVDTFGSKDLLKTKLLAEISGKRKRPEGHTSSKQRRTNSTSGKRAQ